MTTLSRRAQRTRGAAMIEYVLLLALFTLLAVPGIAQLRGGTSTEVTDTKTRIGGTPLATTPVPTTRPPITTTTAPMNPMVVDAGPDRRVAPDATITVEGTITSPGYPVLSNSWTVTGPVVSLVTVGTLPDTGTPEAVGTSRTFTTRQPGHYFMTLSGTNSLGTNNDSAEVKVTSGDVTASLSASGGSYASSSNTTWYAWARATLVNQFGYAVPETTVAVTWSYSDGTTSSTTCTTSASGTCEAWTPGLAPGITMAKAKLTSLWGPCLDTWHLDVTTATVSKGSLPLIQPTTTTSAAPTTTGAPTTTRSPTTTRVRPSTTQHNT